MNREIEFRGKSSHSGEWIFGSLLKIDSNYHIVTESDMCEDGHHIRQESDTPNWVDQDTVGQFTGLRDKNGVKIFKGDIIYSEFSDGSNCHCLVGWNDKEVCFGLMDEYAFRSKQEGYDFPKFDSLVLLNFRNHGMKFEVIGNIIDNKELLNN